MGDERYIKNLKSKYVYPWSEVLAERSDHAECDLKGKLLLVKEDEEAAEAEPAPEPEKKAAPKKKATPKKAKKPEPEEAKGPELAPLPELVAAPENPEE